MPVTAALRVERAAPGLTSADVEDRRRRGAINAAALPHSRSATSIILSNLFTRFNVLLGVLLVAILIIGPLQDALFGLILVVNTPIGIIQELRAKRTLDRLVMLTAPTAMVLRDGDRTRIASADIVLDDVVVLHAGDQVAVDGEVIASDGLEVDEALLTGEAMSVPKRIGDAVLSGSFVVAGGGMIRASRVGKDSYASRLTLEARRFRRARSELRRGVDRLLLMIGIVMVPTGTALVISQISANDAPAEAVRSSVAGLVTMVPEGLVLLTSVVFAIAAVRFARRGAVTQELESVEMLARADVICLDKTGTLTDGSVAVEQVIAMNGARTEDILGAIAAADPSPNPTLGALASAFAAPASGWTTERIVPFSSARKWSAASFVGRGWWVLGAPEMLSVTTNAGEVGRLSTELARGGARVLVLGSAAHAPDPSALHPPVTPCAIVVLRERLRPDAREVIDYYRRQGLAVKVMSGDHPETVAAAASAAGLPRSDRIISGEELPSEPEELANVGETTTVFGRMSPHNKRDIVKALQSRGHVVAMTGDGVNDVLAVKAADVGIAMASGSEATRAVARLTLLHDSFAVVPFAVSEGRRVIANLEQVATFFLTKSVYAFVLAAAVTLRVVPYPLLPRQFSLVGLVAVGIPAFVLSFAPRDDRARPGFVRRTLAFALPGGLVAGAASYVAYELALGGGAEIGEARTVATVVLVGIGLWIVGRIAWPLRTWKLLLIGAMVGCVALAFLIPFGRFVYGLNILHADAWLDAVLITAAAVAVLEAVLRTRLLDPARWVGGTGAPRSATARL